MDTINEDAEMLLSSPSSSPLSSLRSPPPDTIMSYEPFAAPQATMLSSPSPVQPPSPALIPKDSHYETEESVAGSSYSLSPPKIQEDESEMQEDGIEEEESSNASELSEPVTIIEDEALVYGPDGETYPKSRNYLPVAFTEYTLNMTRNQFLKRHGKMAEEVKEEEEEKVEEQSVLCCRNYKHHERTSAVGLFPHQEDLIQACMLSLLASPTTSDPFTISTLPTAVTPTHIYKLNLLTNYTDVSTYLFYQVPSSANPTGPTDPTEPEYVCIARLAQPQKFDPSGKFAYLNYMCAEKGKEHRSMIRVGVCEVLRKGMKGEERLTTSDKTLDKALGF